MASVNSLEIEHEITPDNGDHDGARSQVRQVSLVRLIFSCMVAGGIQYGWALQLSLLTPYVQTLGISHTLSSIIWLCGPIAGFFVQPLVGLWSDKCRSRFGRRRPFILVGCLIICTAVTGIGFSSYLGFALGDTKEHCSIYQGPRWKAAFIFIAGFWVLDFSNNAVQGPTRALMADLSGPNGCNTANAIFCSWMAFGNILGYSSGASGKWYRFFTFLQTKACCEACANLKGAFLVAVILYSVPFAYTAQLAANHSGGQGLCTGVLNISIVIPQMIIALGAGPFDSIFNKGNTPAFTLASMIAFCCGIAGLFLLPNFPKSNFQTAGFGGH